MFIFERYIHLTVLHALLLVLFYVWLWGRYRQQGWFPFFTIGYALFTLVPFGAMWGYLLYGREAWFWEEALGLNGEWVIMAGIAYMMAGGVSLLILIGALGLRLALFAVTWIRATGSGVPDEGGTGARGRAGRGSGELSRAGFLARGASMAGLGVDLAPVIGTAGVLTGMFLGSREIVTERMSMELPDLHDDLRGLRIVQISDVHVGSLIDDVYLHFCLDQLRAARGDLLVVTGDLIDFHNRAIPDTARFLNRAMAHFPLGVLVVTGNHDYFYDGNVLKRELSRSDFRLLLNERITLSRGRGRLEFVGLEYPWPFYPGRVPERRAAARAYFQRAMRGARRVGPRIVLNHDPAEFQWMQNEDIDLLLSGHTHGGQVHIPGPNGGSWAPIESLRYKWPYVHGHYAADRARLYVNRGLGHSLPLRIECPPEISVFQLS